MGPLGTSVTECPIVPAPGDYDDGKFGGMKVGRGNRTSAEVKKMWIYTFTPPYAFMA
jgi:hypothetical protein